MESNDPISKLDSLSLSDTLVKKQIESSLLRTNEEESLILNKTLNLSLDDSKKPQTPSLSAFHRHNPFKASPLRRSISYEENEDIEMLDQDQDQDQVSEDNDNELLDEDITMEDASNISLTEKIGKTTSLIMSPTVLGARVATSNPRSGSPYRANILSKLETEESDDSLLSDNASINTSSYEDDSRGSIRSRNCRKKEPSKLSKHVYTQDYDETTDEDSILADSSLTSSIDTSSKIIHYQTPAIQTNWRNQPIQLQMHHHHYYPSTPQTFPSDSNSESESDILLPAPWSKYAKPMAQVPYLISSYLQLIFNAVTSGLVLYLLISAIMTVRSDINSKIEEHQTNLIIEMQYCANNYRESKCDNSPRAPALEKFCIDWERCMNRDPSKIASKSSVSAETLGIIVNSLIEPIGAKAIVVFIVGVVIWSFTSNFIFGFIRAKSYYGWNNNENGERNNKDNSKIWAQPYQQQVEYSQSPVKAIQLNNGYYTSTPSK